MGKVLITGGGGAGGMSDDMTAANGVTADLVPKGQTYIGSDTDDEIGTGTMELEATANAQTGHVLKGEKFFTKNEQLPDKPLVGTMPDIGALDTTNKARISGNNLVLGMSNGAHIKNGGSGTTGVPEVQISFDEISKNASLKGQINAGIIKKNSKILGVTGTYTGDGNANRGDVLVGKTFSSVNGLGLSGTIPNNGYYKYAGGFGSGKENNVDYYSFNNIPVGYYGEASSNASWAPEIRMKATDFRNYIGAKAENIAFGKVVAGVTGTYYSGSGVKPNSPFVNGKFSSGVSASSFSVTSSFRYTESGKESTNPAHTSGSNSCYIPGGTNDHLHITGINYNVWCYNSRIEEYRWQYNNAIDLSGINKITLKFSYAANTQEGNQTWHSSYMGDFGNIRIYVGNTQWSENLAVLEFDPDNKTYGSVYIDYGTLYTATLDVSKLTQKAYLGMKWAGYHDEGQTPGKWVWDCHPWLDLYSISFT